jgi:hypothetical protein
MILLFVQQHFTTFLTISLTLEMGVFGGVYNIGDCMKTDSHTDMPILTKLRAGQLILLGPYPLSWSRYSLTFVIPEGLFTILTEAIS